MTFRTVKTVLITRVGSGIGGATARRHAADGHRPAFGSA